MEWPWSVGSCAVDEENTLVRIAVRNLTSLKLPDLHTGDVPPPPVYDPGGLTCVVDDFALERQVDWPRVGHELLEELPRGARDRGAVQIVVVSAPEDEEKGRMLDNAGMNVVSESGDQAEGCSACREGKQSHPEERQGHRSAPRSGERLAQNDGRKHHGDHDVGVRGGGGDGHGEAPQS